MPRIGELVGARELRPVLRRYLSIALVPKDKAAEVARRYHGSRGGVYVGGPVWELANGVTIR